VRRKKRKDRAQCAVKKKTWGLQNLETEEHPGHPAVPSIIVESNTPLRQARGPPPVRCKVPGGTSCLYNVGPKRRGGGMGELTRPQFITQKRLYSV